MISLTAKKVLSAALLATFASTSFAAPDLVLNTSNGLSSNDARKLLVASDGSLYVGTANGLTRFVANAAPLVFTQVNGHPLEIITALGEGINKNSNSTELDILVGYAITGRVARGWGIETLVWKQSGTSYQWNWGPESNVHYYENWISAINVNATSDVDVLSINNTSYNVGGYHFSLDLGFANTSNYLGGESLYAVIEWNNQRLIGGDDGLFVFDNYTHSVFQLDATHWHGSSSGMMDAMLNKNVRAITKDNLGNVWIGLQADSYVPGGLVQFTPQANDLLNGTFQHAVRLPGTSVDSNHVNAIVVDASNNVWVATDDGLKQRKTDGTFVNVTTADGLPSNKINDLAFDATTKFLWIATDNGVTRLLTA